MEFSGNELPRQDCNQFVDVFQSDPAWTNQQFYFKAGSDCQDNSGPTNEGSAVAFYELSVAHLSPPSPAPVITLTNWMINALDYFHFTLLGPDEANYFIQSSTDLVSWSFIAFTNAVLGPVDFADTTTNSQAA